MPKRTAANPLLLATLGVVAACIAICLLQGLSGPFGRGANGIVFGTVYTLGVALAAAVCLARVACERAERRAWLALGGALTLSASANGLFSLGWFDRWPTTTISSFVWIGAYILGFLALVTLVRSRLHHVSIAAWLDGVVGAFVIESFTALAFLRPVEAAIAQGDVASAAYLAFPVLDVFLVTLLAAAAAHSRWQLRGWRAIGAGCLLMAVADGANVANIVRGALTPVSFANAAGMVPVLFFAYAAWQAPPPAPVGRRPWPLVPAVFGLAALLAVALAALGAHNQIALALGGVALVAVIWRFALTLSANEQMLEAAKADAVTDALTGLPNRRRLVEDLERCCGKAAPDRLSTLMLFDLDGFKGYNDTFGHQAGDALLAEMGRRLARAVDGFAVVYRMGGDEFCLLAEDPAAAPEAVGGRALRALTEACDGLAIGASAGLVVIPTEARDAAEALRLADQRMYRDKRGATAGSVPQAAAALLGAFEGRDASLEEHAAHVGELAAAVAARLGAAEEEVERVRLAGMLHEVGKVALPDAILGKPGPLDEAEWEFMRRHPLIGARMLEATPVLADVARLVRSCHERVDGGGYPQGLSGEEIELGARIVLACDAYDAMICARPYRRAITPQAAMAELHRCAGTQFDPRVVRAVCEVLEARAARPGPASRAARA